MLPLVMLGCREEPVPPERSVQWLEPSEQAVRVSMALRGLRPNPEELQQVVDGGQAALAVLVDRWVASPEFAATIRDMHAEQLLIRTDVEEQLPLYGPLETFDTTAVHQGLTDVPLKLIEDVVVSGRPYSEIVTAQHFRTNVVYAAVHGLPFEPGGPEWQEVQWADGRPLAGLLSDSELWRRHRSAGSNFHRGRANFVSSTLLCENFATRDVPVEGGIDLSDEFAVAEAVTQQGTCIACHQALDPMAAYFWGFRHQLNAQAVRNSYGADCQFPVDTPSAPPGHGVAADLCYPLRFYQPELENDWMGWQLRPPGYFGLPGSDLADLGAYIASDARFAECTTRRFWSWFAQVPTAEVDAALVSELTSVLTGSGQDTRALIKAIVLHERFLSRDDGVLTTRPEQLSRAIEDLTGFRWTVLPDERCGTECWGTVELTNTDRYGFRAMAGGVDGLSITLPTHSPTPVRRLVLDRLASEAAHYVTSRDLAAPPAERRLLALVERDTTDEAVLRAQIVSLLARVEGEIVRPRDPEVDDVLALWTDALALTGDGEQAWRVVLAALLQDSRMEFH
jgi:hypothetical protein